MGADILLRDHEPGDIEAVFELDSDPLVQEFLGGVKTRVETEKGLAYVLKNRARFAYPLRAIVHRGDAKVIGYCGMQPLEDFGPEIFYGLNSRYWGKGYCRQAVLRYLESEAAGIGKVYATVHPDNRRSMRLLEAVGFLYAKDIFYAPRKCIHGLFLKEQIFQMDSQGAY